MHVSAAVLNIIATIRVVGWLMQIELLVPHNFYYLPLDAGFQIQNNTLIVIGTDISEIYANIHIEISHNSEDPMFLNRPNKCQTGGFMKPRSPV